MKIIIIDGWHKGNVPDWHKPSPEITLLKPKTVTVCDCDEMASMERFEDPEELITYKALFTFVLNGLREKE